MSNESRTVIIGIGNELRGDDAAGIIVARSLRDMASCDADVYEQDGEVNALLDALATANTAFVVDSTASGVEPGVIRRIDLAKEALDESLPRTSSHAIGLADALELARALDQLPDNVVVYGIEGEDFSVGSTVSSKVAAAAAEVVAALRTEIDNHRPST